MSENTVFDSNDITEDIGNTSNTDVYFDAELYPNEDLETLDLDHPAFTNDNVNPEEWDVNELDFDQGDDLNLLDDLVTESSKHDGDGEVAKLEAMLAFWEAMASFDGVIAQLDESRTKLSKKVVACDGCNPKLEKDLVELKDQTLKTYNVALRLDTDLYTLTAKTGSEDEHVIEIDNHMDILCERLSMFNDRVIALIKQYNAL